jgi:GTP-binding protein EngB required for normal cell division
MNFQETKSQAKEIIRELIEIAEHSVRIVLQKPDGEFHKSLQAIEQQVDTQRFTVGVVGVYNTGKSMLLNALLQRELLSTGATPETAAITRLNHSFEERATVYYWTTEQWKSIEEQGKKEDALKGKQSKITQMVQEIKASPQFGELITLEGHSEDVPLNEIRRYTSANAKEKYAQLVREVEIGINIDLVKDNIQIVDTPGLNDPIQIRDHITEEKFLPQCDLLVLLLPANQVFTDSDRRFLERQLEKKRIHKLFVVITWLDKIRKKEWDPIIAFAREHLEKVFQESLDADSAKDLAKKIEIFPLSAWESFLNRVPKEKRILQGEEDEEDEDKPKWTDEQSGVPAFEKRLREFLFEGERAQEIQRIIKHRLKTVILSSFPNTSNIWKGLENKSNKHRKIKLTIWRT